MMAKTRNLGLGDTAMPRSGRQPGNFPRGGPGRSKTKAGRSASAVQPPGQVKSQRNSSGGSRPHDFTAYERNALPRPVITPPRRGREPNVSMADTDMPRVGHQSATAPGALARPGSERGSATMDARSSVPASIQESCAAGDTRDRFGSLGMYEKDQREDNAELDDGVGTGRRSRGSFRGNRRM
jgi:hypothetical protein